MLIDNAGHLSYFIKCEKNIIETQIKCIKFIE